MATAFDDADARMAARLQALTAGVHELVALLEAKMRADAQRVAALAASLAAQGAVPAEAAAGAGAGPAAKALAAMNAGAGAPAAVTRPGVTARAATSGSGAKCTTELTTPPPLDTRRSTSAPSLRVSSTLSAPPAFASSPVFPSPASVVGAPAPAAPSPSLVHGAPAALVDTVAAGHHSAARVTGHKRPSPHIAEEDVARHQKRARPDTRAVPVVGLPRGSATPGVSADTAVSLHSRAIPALHAFQRHGADTELSLDAVCDRLPLLLGSRDIGLLDAASGDFEDLRDNCGGACGVAAT